MAVTEHDPRLMNTVPQGGWFQRLLDRSAVVRILVAGRLLWPIGILAVTLFVSLLLAILAYFGLLGHRAAVAALLVGMVISALTFLIAGERLRRQLLKPLARLEQSVAQVCQGEPGARLPLDEERGVLDTMVRDIDSLSEELTDLYEDMDSRVARQTTRLAQKTGALRILYDIAASINHADDLDALLLRYMRVMKEMVNGRSATMRLRSADGQLRLIGCITPQGESMREHEMLPVQLCRCGRTLSPGDILCEQNAGECSRLNGRRMYGADEVEQILVPLEYQGSELGLCTLYVTHPGVSGREDILELLSTIGNHLGMAVAKQRSDAEARRLSIVEERNHLAHELHDSLAQTLASLRFQVRMLEETLEQKGGTPEARHEAQRIRNGLDEAHTELRDLLNSFRAPMGHRGLDQSLEKLVERFRQETGISTFLQQHCRNPQLSANEEMQMVRIVQEALTNIRKHANAHTVRVLLRCQAPGTYVLLVEDDGVGFEGVAPEGHPGEHIGLSIMEERARRIGGSLRIESEAGEGTRVEFIFKPGERLRTAQRGMH